MKWRRGLIAVTLMSLSLAVACRETAAPAAAPKGPLRILTSFYPVTYFTERLAGDLVEVSCPLPEDADPIFWMPDAAALAAFQAADLIVINGAGFEKWVDKVSLPESKVVRTAGPLREELIHYQDAVTHSHGKAGAHAHEGLDGHTWLDPINAKVQVKALHAALKRLLPEASERLDQNLATLEADLTQLDAALRTLSQAYQGETILASHPAYNYIGRRYGWKLYNLDLDPEEMPSDEAFAEIKTILAQRPARHLLWESAPTPAIAAQVKARLGLDSVELSPCELLTARDRAAGADLLSVMKANSERLRPVLTSTAPASLPGAQGAPATP